MILDDDDGAAAEGAGGGGGEMGDMDMDGIYICHERTNISISAHVDTSHQHTHNTHTLSRALFLSVSLYLSLSLMLSFPLLLSLSPSFLLLFGCCSVATQMCTSYTCI